MSDRVDMLEAALDLLEEGVAVLDPHAKVVFWNRAAIALTGYRNAEMLSRPCPAELYHVHARSLPRRPGKMGGKAGEKTGQEMAAGSSADGTAAPEDPADEGFLLGPALVTMRHRLGHTLPALLRRVPLRDADGARMGAALLFHPVEEADALQHGESGDAAGVERGAMEERLERAQQQWAANRIPFGLLWATVDQATSLRRTHGKGACESMLRVVEQTLLRGLRPTDLLGRWGEDEFLVVSPERTEALLLEHAAALAGLARTADFRWWGDRVSLTLSIGAAHVGQSAPETRDAPETQNTPETQTAPAGQNVREGQDEGARQTALGRLLERARQAMQASIHAGGNQVTHAGGRTCSQS
jgi:diguanylate cyclase (GGDEF)-like protein/PAS domain S-box-containing protein